MRFLPVLLLFAASAAGARAPEPDIFLLAGQSNMSGRGALDALTEAERAADPRIRLYGNDGRWRPAMEPLDDAAGQIDAVSADRQAAVGPGLFFARAFRGNRPVVLLPCAKGGSAITRWRPGGARDTLYGSCLARAREAGGRVRGILWYQGESDTASVAAAARWSAEFAALVAAFRNDLEAPRMPIAFVQLGDRPEGEEGARRYPAWQMVQQAQARLRLKCVTLVPARGLARNPDGLHLSTAGQRLLGVRLAAAMRQLIKRRCK